MSRTKKNNNITRLTLKKENEHLKSVIKQLNITLKKLQKEFDIKELKIAKVEPEEEKSTRNTRCPKCSTGKLIESSLGIKFMVSCSEKCGYRLLEKSK